MSKSTFEIIGTTPDGGALVRVNKDVMDAINTLIQPENMVKLQQTSEALRGFASVFDMIREGIEKGGGQ